MQDRTHSIIRRLLTFRLFGCALLALYIPAGILAAAEAGTTAVAQTRKPEGTSPDRSTLMPGINGGLTTRFGTFTFNPTNPPSANFCIFLNGSYVGGIGASKMVVQNGGNLYAYYDDQWHKWTGNGFAASNDSNMPNTPAPARSAVAQADSLPSPTSSRPSSPIPSNPVKQAAPRPANQVQAPSPPSGAFTTRNFINDGNSTQSAGVPTKVFGQLFRDGDICNGTAPQFLDGSTPQPFSASIPGLGCITRAVV